MYCILIVYWSSNGIVTIKIKNEINKNLLLIVYEQITLKKI